MNKFSKRRYRKIGDYGSDICFVWRNRSAVLGILRGKTIDPGFRERLMLAVTAVNDCRYCSFVHTRQALREGVTPEEINALFEKSIESLPEYERTALLYAQHWVESSGNPEQDLREKLHAEYGDKTANRIETTIRLINWNNLSGNTFDWLLHTVSFGFLGTPRK
jgi:AhpD family alkylhydroperoxidase